MFSNQDDPNLKINSNRTSSSSSSGEVKSRPSSDPKGKKDFKKLLVDGMSVSDEQEMVENAEDLLGDALDVDDATGKKKAPPSIFQLTSAAQSKKPTMLEESADAVKATPTDSPDKLFSKLASAPKKVDTSAETPEELEEAEEEVAASAKAALPPVKQEKFTMKFSAEQQDLSYINPMTLSKSIEAPEIGEKQTLPTTNINDLVTQMVEKVQEMKGDGKTETTVTLKYPPLFSGANLTVTAYDSAKGEFNVSFDNLRNEAKAVLDAIPNREALQQALIDKGYTVHIITTSTLIENRPIITAQTEQTPDRRDQQGKQQRQQKGSEDQA